MYTRMESIRKKRAQIDARNIINQIPSVSLIDFEEENSIWVNRFNSIFKTFTLIDSIPVNVIEFGNNRDNYILWIQNSFNFMKNNKEWLIIIPNSGIWANILVNNFCEAILSLWDISQSNELVVADKKTLKIAAVFCEENRYELHKGHWEGRVVKD